MRIQPSDLIRQEDYELVTMETVGDEELSKRPISSSISVDEQEIGLNNQEDREGIPTKTKVAIVGCLCCFCCTLLGLILMVIFGGVCAAGSDWSCGVGGTSGGLVMLLIGISPFGLFTLVVIYNTLYFCTFTRDGKPADSKHWPVLQI